jgi:hypothetical protein
VFAGKLKEWFVDPAPRPLKDSPPGGVGFYDGQLPVREWTAKTGEEWVRPSPALKELDSGGFGPAVGPSIAPSRS